MGLHRETIAAAKLDMQHGAVLDEVSRIHNLAMIGRCHAALGDVDAATSAFRRAVEECIAVSLPLLHVLVLRDMHRSAPLAPATDRDGVEQEMRHQLDKLILPASRYEQVLGLDLREP